MLHLKETLQSNISKIFLSKSEPSALQSSKSSSIMSSTVAFVHDSPQQLLHALMHLIPFFLHEHAAVPHGFFEDVLQRHLTTFSNHSGAGSASVLIGVIQPFSSFYPQFLASKIIKSRYFHWQTWS